MARSNYPEKVILGIFVLALIFLTAKFVNGRINIVVPWGLIAIFISLYLFREYHRVRRAKREDRREYMNQHRQELLNNIFKKNKKTTQKPD